VGEPGPAGSPISSAEARLLVVTTLHQLIDTLTQLSSSDPSVQASPSRDLPLLLDAAEAAKLLSLSRAKVCEMASRSELPSIRVGRALRIPRDPLLTWIDRSTNVAAYPLAPRLPEWVRVDRSSEL